MEIFAKIVLYIFLIPVIIIAAYWIYKGILGSLGGLVIAIISLFSLDNKIDFKDRIITLFVGILILCFCIFMAFLGWKLLELIFNI